MATVNIKDIPESKIIELVDLSDDSVNKIAEALVRKIAVDAVPVVRCKDCVFWGAKKDWIDPNRKCLQLDFDTASMFFCGFAERKEGK